MKRVLLSLLFLAFLAAGAAPSLAGEELVAVVNGAGITKAEYDRNWPAFLRRLGIPLSHADKSGKVEEFRQELLDILINQELLFQEAEKLGQSAGKEEVGEAVARERENFAKVVDKAITAFKNSGYDPRDHLADARKMVRLGSGAQREVQDIALTR